MANTSSSSNGSGLGSAAPMGSAGKSATIALTKSSSTPNLNPPDPETDAGLQAWLNDKRVVQTWSLDQERNIWANFSGIGWKKFGPSSTTSAVAFMLMATSARKTNSPVNYFENDTTKIIEEMYVW
jgi:hypothetical protein